MPWVFETKCEWVPTHLAYHLHDMEDRAKEVTYETVRRNLGTAALREMFPQYVWGPGKKKGIRLHRDPYVRYYRSVYRGKLCYDVDWSSIDHIWVWSTDGSARGKAA